MHNDGGVGGGGKMGERGRKKTSCKKKLAKLQTKGEMTKIDVKFIIVIFNIEDLYTYLPLIISKIRYFIY